MASDAYRFRRPTYLQGEIDTSLLVDLENNAALLEFGEAGCFRGQGVVTRGSEVIT